MADPGDGDRPGVGSERGPDAATVAVFDRFTGALDPPLLVVTALDGRDRDG